MSSVYVQQPLFSIGIAKPFIKWAGGKQRLLTQYQVFFPASFDRYFEPFLGGGSVFFHLWSGGRIQNRAYLSDANDELTNLYTAVRNDIDELMRLLSEYKREHCRDYYYGIRRLDRQESNLTEVERAARTLYLNRTCFNGLYRVNSLGQFNVPIGSYKNPRLFDEQSLRAASVALQDSIIETRDFRSIVEMAEPGDFFYFDPPYYPLGKTASFTGYTSKGFDDEDHRELAEVFTTLSRKGCLCMLSNSHTPFILDLYEGYRIESAKALRSINSNTGGRHAVAEIIVLNYWDRGK